MVSTCGASFSSVLGWRRSFSFVDGGNVCVHTRTWPLLPTCTSTCVAAMQGSACASMFLHRLPSLSITSIKNFRPRQKKGTPIKHATTRDQRHKAQDYHFSAQQCWAWMLHTIHRRFSRRSANVYTCEQIRIRRWTYFTGIYLEWVRASGYKITKSCFLCSVTCSESRIEYV